MSAYFEGAQYVERDELMFYYRQLGMPYRTIGAKWGLTTERVRQILAGRARRVLTHQYHDPLKLEHLLATDRPRAHAANLFRLLSAIG